MTQPTSISKAHATLISATMQLNTCMAQWAIATPGTTAQASAAEQLRNAILTLDIAVLDYTRTPKRPEPPPT